MKGFKQMVKNKILIVDDEVFNLDLLEYALESLNDIVITRASNAAMALDILQNSKQDLIILDISMPGMTGLEMLQKLKQLALELNKSHAFVLESFLFILSNLLNSPNFSDDITSMYFQELVNMKN